MQAGKKKLKRKEKFGENGSSGKRWGRKTSIWVINRNVTIVKTQTTTIASFYVLCQREHWAVWV